MNNPGIFIDRVDPVDARIGNYVLMVSMGHWLRSMDEAKRILARVTCLAMDEKSEHCISRVSYGLPSWGSSAMGSIPCEGIKIDKDWLKILGAEVNGLDIGTLPLRDKGGEGSGVPLYDTPHLFVFSPEYLPESKEVWNYVMEYRQYDDVQEDAMTSIDMPRIEYVHQLQNLYYAMTGLELPIDEKLLKEWDSKQHEYENKRIANLSKS